MASPSSSVRKQPSISPSPQLPPTLPMVSTANKIKGRVDGEYDTYGQCPQPEQEGTSVSPQKPESAKSQAPTDQPPSWKLGIRDLATQPIQRVMRYVLLYRGAHC